MTRHRLFAIAVLVLSIILLAFGCKLDEGNTCSVSISDSPSAGYGGGTGYGGDIGDGGDGGAGDEIEVQR